MAINSTKLLPASKALSLSKSSTQIKTLSFDKSLGGLVDKTQKLSPNFIGQEKKILIVKTQVIKIENLIQRKYVEDLKRKGEDDRNREKLARKKKEEKLEEKPKDDEKISKVISLPKIGFLDGIKNFLVNLVLGFVAFRLIEHLPKIVKFARILAPAVDFFIDFSGKLLNGLVTFIDWGYRAYDATRGFIKTMGGNTALKVFDGFNGAVGKVIDAAIIAAIAFGELGGDDGGGGFGGGGRRGAQPGTVGGFRKTGGENGRWQGFTLEKAKGGDFSPQSFRKTENDIMKRYFQRFGRDKFIQRFGEEGLEALPKSMARSGLTKFGRRAFVGLLGKGGAKTVLGFVRPLLKRIPVPVVGALIDFGLSWALGENPGRAAFRAIGAAILGTIGGGLAGALGLAGGPLAIATAALGSIAGGTLGDMAGGALYDLFFGGKKTTSTKTKTTKAAGGGVATRGGKLVSGGAKRSVEKKKVTRSVKITPESVEPGKDIGGKNEIKKIFPEPKQTQKDTINPLGYLSETSKILGKAPFFGPLFNIALKAILGDKPSSLDYKNIGMGLNSWLSGTLSSGGGFAEGGEVDASMFMKGEDYSNIIATSVKDSVTYEIEKSIKELRQNLMLKSPSPGEAGGPGEGKPSDDLPPGSGTLTGNTNAEKVFNYLIGYGFTPQAAAGVIGNLMQESHVDPKSHQSGGGIGRGIMQWSVDQRWASLTAWATSANKDPWALDTQVEWMMKEMNQRGTIKRLKGLTNVKAATDLFEKEMEGAGTPMMENRYSYAADALASFGGGGAGGDGFDKGGVGGSIAEYITGDPNTPFGRFDKAGHGTTANYHDHIGFKDRNTAVRAYNFFKSKGLKVTEFKGFDSVGGHASGSLHYSGLAFDVPGSQWGGSGAIGSKEYQGSAKVRSVLKDFMGGSVKLARGGLVRGMTHAMIGEKGAEFVLDADTTLALNTNMPGFLDKLNRANNIKTILGVLQKYASYEQGAEPEVILQNNYEPSNENEDSTPGSSKFVPIPMGGSGSSDPFAVLDRLPG